MKMFETIEERRNDFEKLWTESGCSDSGVLFNIRIKLEPMGFFTAPASTKYHGDYEGGLYEHSRMVYMRLKELTEKLNLKWQRPESPFIIGMFHDICKCDQYIKVPGHREDLPGSEILQYNAGFHYEYNKDTLLKGHGDKSVMILSQYMTLTEEEMLCILYHMGAYTEKEEWPNFDRAIKRYPLVLISHTADMMASKWDGI